MKRCPKLTKNQIRRLRQIIASNKYSSRETRRAQAILMLDSATDYTAIAILTGCAGEEKRFDRGTDMYDAGVKEQKIRRREIRKNRLPERNGKKLIETVKTKTPNRCGGCRGGDCRTTSIAAEYIKRSRNVAYKSKTSICIVFRQAAFSCRKPLQSMREARRARGSDMAKEG